MTDLDLDPTTVLYGRLGGGRAEPIFSGRLIYAAETELAKMDDELKTFLRVLGKQEQPLKLLEVIELIYGSDNGNSRNEAMIWKYHVDPVLQQLIAAEMVEKIDKASHRKARWSLSERGRAAAYLLSHETS